MADLSKEQLEQLKSLLKNAKPAAVLRLMSLFERMSIQGVRTIPTKELIEAMREVGLPQAVAEQAEDTRILSFERLFFEPFENLFETPGRDPMLPGALPRNGLDGAWAIITQQLAVDDYLELEPLGTAATLSGDTMKARDFAQKLRQALLKAIDGFSDDKLEKLSPKAEVKAILRRLRPLLHAEAAGRQVWYTAVSPRGELSDTAVATLSDCARHFDDICPRAACELLLLTMSILPRPTQALRVLTKIARGYDDRKLENTHFVEVGRRLLGLTRKEGQLIEAAAIGSVFDPIGTCEAVERFSHLSNGMTREANLASDGPWRKELNEIRARTGTQLEKICKNGQESVANALPLDRVRKKAAGLMDEPRYHAPINPMKVEIAACHVRFLTETRLFAPLAGFGGFRDNAAKEITLHLDMVGEALVRIAREDPEAEHLGGWIEALVTLVEASEGERPALVIARRIEAAREKAA